MLIVCDSFSYLLLCSDVGYHIFTVTFSQVHISSFYLNDAHKCTKSVNELFFVYYFLNLKEYRCTFHPFLEDALAFNRVFTGGPVTDF